MQTIGPYRLMEMLSLRPAGRVWRGVDQYGAYVTIAVLETAEDDRAQQFRAAASAPLQGQVVSADLAGPRPWVALAEDGGPGALQVFTRMAGAPLPQAPAAEDVATAQGGERYWPPTTHFTVPERDADGLPVADAPHIETEATPTYALPPEPNASEPAPQPAGQDPNAGFAGPNAYADPNAGFADPNAYAEPNAGFADPNAYADPNAGYADPNAYADPSAYVDPNAGYADPNSYADPNAGFAAPAPGYPGTPPQGYPGTPAPQGFPNQPGYPPAPGQPGAGPAGGEYGPPQGYPELPPGYGPAPQSPPAGYGGDPYAQPGYGPAPQSGPPGYGVAPQSPPAGHTAPPGYGPTPSSGPPGYGPTPSSGPPGYGPTPSSGPPGYGPAPSSGPPGYGPAPSSGPPGYGQPPTDLGGWHSPAKGPAIPPSPPGRGRGLLIGLIALVVVLILGVSGVIVWTLNGSPDDSDPKAEQTALPTATPKASDRPEPKSTVPSKSGGKEPPKPGAWPAAWPTFSDSEPTVSQEKPGGLGFSFTLPNGWNCDKIDQAGAYAKYECKDSSGSGAEPAGGELIVRSCSEPCDAKRKIAMRKAEDAWSLQWIKADDHSSYAETDRLAGQGGSPRYGLVVVRYWHSQPGSRLDRQLVFRMTSPPDGKADIQKIMNSIRPNTR